MRLPRRARPPLEVAEGERVLAWAEAPAGVVAGTRDALYVRLSSSPGESGAARIPWELVEAADWDRETSVLRVSEVGSWGERRPEHRVTLEEPGRLLELVRERVTASVVLQRHVPVHGRRGLRVIARRAPRGDRPISWVFEYDEGVDPGDPEVVRLAGEALAAAREEVGTL
ncbi:hypothetical protein [Nocardioides panaciterrulae]|uniref:Uncharacterized protein n=1 Tax=Nocardioides panaciterrulae TaxID=661492 RepID=A0A7Y9JA81_9ACTN|nr:hypothetical protein [Nocardioides panaciterrulae]NYD41407.1 hypothetical protein [Nocardioides panaciterrulae]